MTSDSIFELISNNAPDAIIWADADGIVRYWNRGAEELFGWRQAEMLGRSMEQFIAENLRDRHREGYHRVMAGGESRYGRRELLKIPALRADGSRISIEFTLQALEHPAFGLIAIATLRDATETFDELRELRRRLADAEAPEASAE